MGACLLSLGQGRCEHEIGEPPTPFLLLHGRYSQGHGVRPVRGLDVVVKYAGLDVVVKYGGSSGGQVREK